MTSEDIIRQAPFALRVTQRKGGKAAIIYRRRANVDGKDRLQRLGALSPLAYQAALPLLRDAVRSGPCETSPNECLQPGPFVPLDAAWGARVACFALVAAGLLNGQRLLRSAEQLRHADPDQASWWLGLLSQPNNVRALRALRILTEAVE